MPRGMGMEPGPPSLPYQESSHDRGAQAPERGGDKPHTMVYVGKIAPTVEDSSSGASCRYGTVHTVQYSRLHTVQYCAVQYRTVQHSKNHIFERLSELLPLLYGTWVLHSLSFLFGWQRCCAVTAVLCRESHTMVPAVRANQELEAGAGPCARHTPGLWVLRVLSLRMGCCALCAFCNAALSTGRELLVEPAAACEMLSALCLVPSALALCPVPCTFFPTHL